MDLVEIWQTFKKKNGVEAAADIVCVLTIEHGTQYPLSWDIEVRRQFITTIMDSLVVENGTVFYALVALNDFPEADVTPIVTGIYAGTPVVIPENLILMPLAKEEHAVAIAKSKERRKND